MTYGDKDILVVGVAQGSAPLIAVALSAERSPILEPGERPALRLIEYCGDPVGGEPA